MADVTPLTGIWREIAIEQLARVGGYGWACREVDRPEFIEQFEKVAAKVFNDVPIGKGEKEE